MRRRVGVLALQGDVREHSAAIQSVGAVASHVRRADDLKSIDAIILPGGESTTIAKLLRIFDLFIPLREAISGGMPVFGTCAGMILLAKEVIDGSHDQETLTCMDIAVRRNAFGRQVDSFETELDLSKVGLGITTTVFIRAPWIENYGTKVEILASVANESGMHPVLAREGSMLASAFHPEILSTGTGSVKLMEPHAAPIPVGVHDYFIREVAS